MQATECESGVARKIVQGDHTARITCFLAESFGATKTQECTAASLRLVHAEPNVFCRFHVQMEGEFLILFGRIARTATKELSDSRKRGARLLLDFLQGLFGSADLGHGLPPE